MLQHSRLVLSFPEPLKGTQTETWLLSSDIFPMLTCPSYLLKAPLSWLAFFPALHFFRLNSIYQHKHTLLPKAFFLFALPYASFFDVFASFWALSSKWQMYSINWVQYLSVTQLSTPTLNNCYIFITWIRWSSPVSRNSIPYLPSYSEVSHTALNPSTLEIWGC